MIKFCRKSLEIISIFLTSLTRSTPKNCRFVNVIRTWENRMGPGRLVSLLECPRTHRNNGNPMKSGIRVLEGQNFYEKSKTQRVYHRTIVRLRNKSFVDVSFDVVILKELLDEGYLKNFSKLNLLNFWTRTSWEPDFFWLFFHAHVTRSKVFTSIRQEKPKNARNFSSLLYIYFKCILIFFGKWQNWREISRIFIWILKVSYFLWGKMFIINPARLEDGCRLRASIDNHRDVGSESVPTVASISTTTATAHSRSMPRQQRNSDILLSVSENPDNTVVCCRKWQFCCALPSSDNLKSSIFSPPRTDSPQPGSATAASTRLQRSSTQVRKFAKRYEMKKIRKVTPLNPLPDRPRTPSPRRRSNRRPKKSTCSTTRRWLRTWSTSRKSASPQGRLLG